MPILDAVLAGTGVIPKYGRSIFTKDLLEDLADQLRRRGTRVTTEHDLDSPIDGVSVLSAEVRPTPDGEYQLHVVLDATDEAAAELLTLRGMSPAVAAYFDDGEATDADVALLVDPVGFSGRELDEAITRLAAAGITTRAGHYYQLAEVTLPVVVLDILRDLPSQLGWAIFTGAIIAGVGRLVRRGRKGKYQFIFRGENGDVVAEVETSSERAFREAVRDLRKIDRQNGGMFVRDKSRREWRKAGDRPRHRARRKAKRNC